MPVIFLAGDSTCATNGSDTAPQAGWGQFLERFVLPGWQVDNRAVNGRSTKSFLDEGRFAAIEAALRPGDWLFLSFGHNDQKSEDPSRYADAWGAYRANLTAMADRAAAAGASCALVSSIARRRFGPDGVLKETLSPYPEAAASVAAERGLPYIDLNLLSTVWLRALGDEASRPYFMRLSPGQFPAYPEGKADDTHLRIEGAVEAACMVAEAAIHLGIPAFPRNEEKTYVRD